MAYGVLMMLSSGKCRKDNTALITPFFSNNVCHAKVRSKKFIHIGRINIRTIKLDEFTLLFDRITAKGYARIRQMTVLIKESRRETEYAELGAKIKITERTNPKKFNESVLLRTTFPSKAQEAMKTALAADTEKPVNPNKTIRIGEMNYANARNVI